MSTPSTVIVINHSNVDVVQYILVNSGYSLARSEP